MNRHVVHYEPKIVACPFCGEEIEGPDWEEHFFNPQTAEIRMQNADVLVTFLVCGPKMKAIKQDEEISSKALAEITMWIPIAASYLEPSAMIHKRNGPMIH